MPVVGKSICDNFYDHFHGEDYNEEHICGGQDVVQLLGLADMIDAQEHGVDNNGGHDEILKDIALHNSEALKSETINRLYRNNLRISMNQKSLDLDPLLLLFGEVMSALSLLNLLIKFIDNDGYEQIHDEEGSQENKDHIE